MQKFKAIITGHPKHPTLGFPVVEVAVAGFPGVILLDVPAAYTLAQEIIFTAGMVTRGVQIQTGIGPQGETEGDGGKEESDNKEEKGPEDKDAARLERNEDPLEHDEDPLERLF